MDLSTLANIATALTVITGVFFALLEARAAFSTVQAMFTPEWIRSAAMVQGIPQGSPASYIENNERLLQAVEAVSVILEGLGYSVFARIIPLHVVEDLLGGVVRVAWRNLRPYVESEREKSGSDKNWEWFQWLAEQIERNGSGRTNLKVGAQRALSRLEAISANRGHGRSVAFTFESHTGFS